jgi:copper(I)-binding protein
MKRWSVSAMMLVLLAALRASPSTASAQVTGTPPATPEAGATASVFLTIANSGCLPDQLTGAESDVAERVEIHETVKDGDVEEMRPLADGLTIPAGKTIRLEPGGDHLMLVGLREELAAGSSILLTLTFDFAGDLWVTATVRDGNGPAAEMTPPAPVEVGTIRVSDVWIEIAPEASGTPTAAGS